MSRRRHTSERSGDESTTLYIRQVHYAARPDDLRVVFERMGPLRDVYIPLDYYTRESRGFAYVKYEDPRDAERAFKQLHGCAILGRRICVEWAEGDRKSKSEMRHQEGRISGRHRREHHHHHHRSHHSSSRRRSRSRGRSSSSGSHSSHRERERSSSSSSSKSHRVKRSTSRSPSTTPHEKKVRKSSSSSSHNNTEHDTSDHEHDKDKK